MKAWNNGVRSLCQRHSLPTPLMLIDTNVVSYIYRNDTRANFYTPHLNGKTLYLSFMTLAELLRWPLQRNWSVGNAQKLEDWIDCRFVILPFDRELARTWARLVGITCQARPVSLPDSWIAATALHYGLPLVTHNRRHFEGIPGLILIPEA
jgi:tRNA(fMet)-specific endonuclease VapC